MDPQDPSFLSLAKPVGSPPVCMQKGITVLESRKGTWIFLRPTREVHFCFINCLQLILKNVTKRKTQSLYISSPQPLWLAAWLGGGKEEGKRAMQGAVGQRTQLHSARKKRSLQSGFYISRASAKGRKPEAARDHSPGAFRAFGKAFGTENRSQVGL